MSDVIPHVNGLPFNKDIALELGRIDGRGRFAGKERCTHVGIFCPLCGSKKVRANIVRRQTVSLVSIFYIADNVEAEDCTAIFYNEERLQQVGKEVVIHCEGCGKDFPLEKFAEDMLKQIKKGERWGSKFG